MLYIIFNLDYDKFYFILLGSEDSRISNGVITALGGGEAVDKATGSPDKQLPPPDASPVPRVSPIT